MEALKIMAKRGRTGRRTHSMLRGAGVSEPTSLPNESFVGSCCKLFFPMEETTGAINDAIGDVVFTPTLADYNTIDGTNAIRIRETGLKAITSGTGPTIGEKDFLLLSAYHIFADTSTGALQVRPEMVIKMYDASSYGPYLFDGDGFYLQRGVNPTDTEVGTETLCGASADTTDSADSVAGVGIVRKGNAAGIWMHNDSWDNLDPTGLRNDYTSTGDVFMRGARVDGHTGEYTNDEASVAINEYDIPEKYVLHYSDTPIPTDPIPNIGYVNGGYPGVWPAIGYGGDTWSPGAITQMQFGIFGAAAQVELSHFGVALFVFEDGLPDDWKEASRWMRDQWIAGNKVIWPDWVSVK